MYTVIISAVEPPNPAMYTYWVHPGDRKVRIAAGNYPLWRPSTNTYEELQARIAANPAKWEVIMRDDGVINETYGAY